MGRAGRVLTPCAPDAAKRGRNEVSHPHWSVSVGEADDHAPAAQVTLTVSTPPDTGVKH